jgi:DNA-binding NarL/FixJ family response regulator/tRNA A-37 threonylcarbamoyl transferase component Bud32
MRPEEVAATEFIRVMVVDDAPMWRQVIRSDLERHADLVVVAEAGDGSEAVERAREAVPDVALMDISMPTMNGIEATRRIRDDTPSVRILVLSQSAEEEDVLGAVRAGAVGYILKSVHSNELVDSVRRVARGEMIFTPALAGLVLDEISHPTPERPPPLLTDRERQVLQLVARGRKESEIADLCSLSIGAVRNELRNITYKIHRVRLSRIRIEGNGHAGPRLSIGDIRRRPTGERPPLPRITDWPQWMPLIAVLATAAVLGVSAGLGVLGRIDQSAARWFEGIRSGAMTSAMRTIGAALGGSWTVTAIRWPVLAVLILYKRWQHALAFLASILLVGWISAAATPSPSTTAGHLAPSPPVAALAVTVVGIAYSLAPPGRRRRAALVAGGLLLAALGFAEMYRGLASLSGVLVAVVLGADIPVVGFRLIAPEGSFPVSYQRAKRSVLDVTGLRGEAIKQALRNQLGMTAVGDVRTFALQGAAGSTPLRIRVEGDPDTDLFGKLYAISHMRSDRWYKLGRMILYGELEDEKPYNSVRRLVEYEDYVLRLLVDNGVPTAAPYGFVELTPEREYLLVTEFLEGTTELTGVQADDRIIRESLAIVRRLWDAGLSHRDIKPSNVLVDASGAVYLIDAAFCQVRPSPWRQAVDLANMMLVLALQADPGDVYGEATKLFRAEEIAEGFAATRGVTMPPQLRRAVQQDGRDLVGAFRAMGPSHDPIGIQRWSVRRVALSAGALLALALAAALVWGNLQAIGR